MATIYRKTAKGAAEIESRANRIVPRARGALILVDGRRSDEELGKLIAGDAQGILKGLADEGYIEPVTPPPRPAVVSGAARRRDEADPRPALAEVRRLAVHRLIELLGPSAEPMAMRIEKQKTWDELLPVLNVACAMVRDARGTTIALGFAERFVTPNEGRK
jgi:hypothetical protein